MNLQIRSRYLKFGIFGRYNLLVATGILLIVTTQDLYLIVSEKNI